VANKPEPYVGPRPFNRQEEAKFFGRENEASELLSLIIAHPVVLLYSESGAGKTSLLNAMVAPMLGGRNSRVFGPARVGGALPQWIKYTDVKNIYTFNAILSMQGELLNSQSVWGMSFADFMKTQEVATKQRQYSRRVVVFDQFEELFSTHHERWKDREFFFNNVCDALEQDSSLRVVFVIREEYIAQMDSFAPLLPERLRTRFRLERLREEAALLAVTMPLKDTGYSFATGAAEKLVRDLLRVPIKSAAGTVEISGEFAEPVQLQVVCQRMWQSLPTGVKEIDERFIENYGNTNDALAAYYDDSVEITAKKSSIKEGVLRRWFGHKLITPDRTRGTVYKDAYVESGLTSGAIAILENLHLIRTEMRGGAPWYELTHDRFIEPIIQSNEDWFDKIEGSTSIGQRLEERAKGWSHDTPDSRYLLSEGELDEALKWLNSADAKDFGVSETLTQFIQASQTSVTRNLHRQRTLLGTALVVTIVACIAAILFYGKIRSLRVRNEDNARIGGNVAKYLSDLPPNEFVALQYGLVAFDAVQSTNPPAEAVDGLRAAITSVGNSTWLRGMTAQFSYAGFSSNSDYALTYGPYEVCVWQSSTGKLLFKTPRKEDGGYSLARLTPDGKRLITIITPKFSQAKKNEAAPDNRQQEYKTEVWDISSNGDEPLQLFPSTKEGIILNDDRHVLILGSDAKSFVINAETINDAKADEKYELHFTTQELESVQSAVIAPDNLHLIITGQRGDLKVWSLEKGEVIKSLRPPENEGDYYFENLLLSVQEQRLVFMAYHWRSDPPPRWETDIYIWDLDSYHLLTSVPLKSSDYSNYSYLSNDGKNLIVLSKKEANPVKVSIWDVANGKQLIDRESTIKGNATFWSNSVGIFVYDNDIKPVLLFEDYYTGDTATLLDSISKYARITYADVSSNGLVLTSIGNTTAYIRKKGSENLNVENYSPAQLKSKACDLLRSQPEFKEVETICNQSDY
jgi:hypothetical protein